MVSTHAYNPLLIGLDSFAKELAILGAAMPLVLPLACYPILRRQPTLREWSWWRLLVLAIGVSGWVELAFIMILAGAFDATSNPRQLAANR